MLRTAATLLVMAGAVGCSSLPVISERKIASDHKSNFVCMSKTEGIHKGCARSPGADSFCESRNEPESLAYLRPCRAELGVKIPDGITEWTIDPIENGRDESDTFNRLPQIPESFFEKYSAYEIAISLVQRKFLQDEIPRASDSDFKSPHYSLYADLRIVMEFPSRHIRDIIRGGFKNLHQTGRSSAFSDAEWRLRRESLFFKAKFPLEAYKQKVLELLPKYAYALPRNDIDGLGPSFLHGYADLVAVFKDEIKLRSTLTWDDSLFGPGSWGLLDVSGRGGFLPPLTFTALNTRCKSFGDRCLARDGSDSGYLEAQIWGPLEWKDVEYLLIGCHSQMPKAEEDRVLSQVGTTVPVFRCRPENKSAKIRQVHRGERLN